MSMVEIDRSDLDYLADSLADRMGETAKRVLAELQRIATALNPDPAIPIVHLTGARGDVLSASGDDWKVYAEREDEGSARCQVWLEAKLIADITVHAPDADLASDAQSICAALLWSTIRARARKRGDS